MKHAFLFTSLLALSAYTAKSQTDADAGKQIFTTVCAACHAVGKQVVGPDLQGIDTLSEQWIINFVHSSQTVIKSGDPRAVEIYDRFSKVLMPDQPTLKDQDIKNVIAYIKQESAVVAKNAKSATATAVESRPYPHSDAFFHHVVFLDLYTPSRPLKATDPILWIIIAAALGMVSSLLFLVRTNDEKG
ncbi:MAG: cytochrome c [Chitinophagaceae bacterium]|jgi:mono/diheme cytochrome c family protein|nr:cytochrome c [Chitinophagaceae bacterium]